MLPPPLKLRPYGGIEMCVLLLLLTERITTRMADSNNGCRTPGCFWLELLCCLCSKVNIFSSGRNCNEAENIIARFCLTKITFNAYTQGRLNPDLGGPHVYAHTQTGQ